MKSGTKKNKTLKAVGMFVWVLPVVVVLQMPYSIIHTVTELAKILYELGNDLGTWWKKNYRDEK